MQICQLLLGVSKLTYLSEICWPISPKSSPPNQLFFGTKSTVTNIKVRADFPGGFARRISFLLNFCENLLARFFPQRFNHYPWFSLTYTSLFLFLTHSLSSPTHLLASLSHWISSLSLSHFLSSLSISLALLSQTHTFTFAPLSQTHTHTLSLSLLSKTQTHMLNLLTHTSNTHSLYLSLTCTQTHTLLTHSLTCTHIQKISLTLLPLTRRDATESKAH